MIADRLGGAEPKDPRESKEPNQPERAGTTRGRADSGPAPRPAARKEAASLEDEDIARAMRENQFKIKVVAEVLGVSRSWLNVRLESCQGIRKAKDLSRAEILDARGAAGGDLSAMAERLEVSEHALKLRMKALEIDGR